MKYKVFLLLVLFVVSFNQLSAQEKPVKFIPEKPQPGTEVTIKFNAESTELENSENVKAIIFWSSIDTLYCDEMQMSKTENGWESKYDIPEKAWIAGIKFSNGKIAVTDSGVVYPMFLYDGNGNYIKGTRAAYACLIVFRNVSPKPDRHLAYLMFTEEFEENPELTKYFLVKYLFALQEEKPDTWLDSAQKILAGINNPEGLNEKALTELEDAYMYLFRDAEKAQEYKNIALKKYPLGYAAQTDAFMEINKMSADSAAQLETAVLNYQNKFEQNSAFSNKLWNKLITAYCENEMYTELDELLSQYTELQKKISTIYALSEGAKRIAQNEGNLDSAKYFADLGYKLAKEYEPTEVEFRGTTQERINAIHNQFMNSVLFNSAYVYEKAGEPEEALKYIEKAYASDEPSVEVKALYAKLLLILNRNYDEALSVSADLIIGGRTDEEIIEINKEAYELVKGSDEGYDEYYAELRKPILHKMEEEIKGQFVNEPAADFSLKDLDGNTITLSGLKGKVIILDFWATWCGPCKASMPYMKQAVEKYADDDEVEFFFVDTFERGSGVEERAAKFMSMNDYPFHVLVDDGGTVARDGYGITAIPAKVFIDKEGNLRYSAQGFNKNTLLDEIDIIIKLLK